jgi:uncharacterized protein Yka (UPF0111/DUF47 family)
MIRWFLPKSPDILGMLAHQAEVTVAGMGAFARWSGGAPDEEAVVRNLEHEADDVRRTVIAAVRKTFVNPISPEDIFEFSERLGDTLNAAKNVVREAEVLAMPPDGAMAEMAELIDQGVRELARAVPALAKESDTATEAADAAIHQQRKLEHVYRRAMSGLLGVEELREVTGRRELYRRYARIGDHVVAAADRIWYAVVKQG